MFCNVGFAESVEDRINKIEERLDKIEKFLKLDQPVSLDDSIKFDLFLNFFYCLCIYISTNL